MSNEDRVGKFVEKARGTISDALDEMTEVNIVRENDATDFPLYQRELEMLYEEASQLITEMPEQEEELRDVQEKIREAHRDMVEGLHEDYGEHRSD